MPLVIGIAYSLIPRDGPVGDLDDVFEEFDRPETIEAIASVLREDGHEVIGLGDGREFIERVLTKPPDFVWNMAEGQGVGRDRESRVPAVLTMLGIPYSGSDPWTLAVSLDKVAAKTLVQSGRIPVRVAEGMVVEPEDDDEEIHRRLEGLVNSVGFPLLLKPTFEGSSKGIRSTSLVGTLPDAVAGCRRLGHDYQQPVLVERFIPGADVTVGVVGNGRSAEVLGVMRIVPHRPDERFIYSLEVKRRWADVISFEAPARLSAEGLEAVRSAALSVYRTLGCRDLARVDFRLKDTEPIFLEVNPLPGLIPGASDLVLLAEGHGISYPALIRRILHAALDRVGLYPDRSN